MELRNVKNLYAVHRVRIKIITNDSTFIYPTLSILA